MQRRYLLAQLAALSGASLLASPSAFAQGKYPQRPITLVVPTAPGGSTDFTARLVVEPLSRALGQPVVVENKPGASGNIGNAYVARAKPDGYSLVVVNLPGYFFVPMYRKSSYTTKDLTLVARLVSDHDLRERMYRYNVTVPPSDLDWSSVIAATEREYARAMGRTPAPVAAGAGAPVSLGAVGQSVGQSRGQSVGQSVGQSMGQSVGLPQRGGQNLLFPVSDRVEVEL